MSFLVESRANFRCSRIPESYCSNYRRRLDRSACRSVFVVETDLSSNTRDPCSLEIVSDSPYCFFEGPEDFWVARVAVLKVVDNGNWLGPCSDEVGESLAENSDRSPIWVQVGLFAVAIGRNCLCSAVGKS